MNKGGNVSASNTSNNSIVGLFSGHTSITAAPDGLIALFPDEMPNGERITTLKTLPREGVAANISFKRHINDEGLWDLECVDSNNLIGTNTLTLKILRVIHNNPTGINLVDLCDTLDRPRNDTTLHDALNYLQSLRIVLSGVRVIDDTRVRYYTLGRDSDWLLGSAVDSITATIEDANSLGSVSSRDDLRELTSTWDRSRTEKALNGMVSREKERIIKLLHTPKYAIDDEVVYKGTVHTVTDISAVSSLRNIRYELDGEDFYKEEDIDPYTAEDLFDV
jgi:hypothetical protein